MPGISRFGNLLQPMRIISVLLIKLAALQSEEILRIHVEDLTSSYRSKEYATSEMWKVLVAVERLNYSVAVAILSPAFQGREAVTPILVA